MPFKLLQLYTYGVRQCILQFKVTHGIISSSLSPPPLITLNRFGFLPAQKILQSAPSRMKNKVFSPCRKKKILKKSRQLLTSCLAVYLWTFSFILSYLLCCLKCLELRLEEHSVDSRLVLKERKRKAEKFWQQMCVFVCWGHIHSMYQLEHWFLFSAEWRKYFKQGEKNTQNIAKMQFVRKAHISRLPVIVRPLQKRKRPLSQTQLLLFLFLLIYSFFKWTK